MTETSRRASLGLLGPGAKAHWWWLVPAWLFPVVLFITLSAYFLSDQGPTASATVKDVCMAWPLLGVWLFIPLRQGKLSVLDAWVFGMLLPFLGMIVAGVLAYVLFDRV